MIVILTDFGNTDIYTPVMQGVIKSINPLSEIIILSNSVKSQNVSEAAFLLGNSYRYFPEGTVFLCVVDPGVGSERKAIAIETEKYYFVAPDNGLITGIIKNEKILNSVIISKIAYLTEKISSTFHGRDVFAPAAALIDKTKDILSVGKKSDSFDFQLINSDPLIKDNRIIGEIIHIDSFGNAISNINSNRLKINKIKDVEIRILKFSKIHKTFSEVNPGEPLSYIGSFGYLEFAVRNGNFAKHFKCNYFDKVQINFDYNS